MFFPRLRRQAKWMFVLLALAFGLGFVVFGVGTGGPGVSEVLGGGGGLFGGDGTGEAVDDARDKVKKSPKDPRLRRELATALVADGKTTAAIAELEKAAKMSPKNPGILSDLADLYATRAARLEERAQRRQAEAAAVSNAAFTPPPTTDLARALSQDALTSAVSTRASDRATKVAQRRFEALQKTVEAYKRLATVRPNDADLQLQLGQAAQNSNDTKTAVAAYKQYLKLAPDADLAPDVRRVIKALEGASTASGTG